MPLTPGTRLGSYEIIATLGAGGMGEVYRARDMKLGRDVALKVLPGFFADDPDRLMRFEREAKTLASLNHPHIAQIYGLIELPPEGGSHERAGRTHAALVMELVEGEDLAQRIGRGPIPLDDSLAMAKQVAEGLEAAHEAGIIHRDLKPANIKVRPDGTVKVLDFGLAKAIAPASDVSPAPGAFPNGPSPTLTSPALTEMGVILGTAAYMAPEQAKGQAVDKRADIWAFGLVLYEMLTGVRPFAGDDPSEMLASVLRQEIDWTPLPASVPQEIRRLLRRCLERQPKNRLHDIADARLVIGEVLSGDRERPVTPAPPATLPRTGLLLAGIVTLLVGVLGGFALGRWTAPATGAAPQRVRFDFNAPEGTSLLRGIAMSPDGRHIAFAARRDDGRTSIWVRTIDAPEPRELPDTIDGRLPFWAPDSRRLGFFGAGALLWTDVVTGGAPIEIAKAAGPQDVRGAAWGADDVIVFSPSYTGPLQRVSLRGGAPVPAMALPATGEIGTARFPAFLPDGRRFVFYAAPGTGTEPGELYLGRVDSLEIKRLGPAHSAAVFATPHFLLYNQGESLVAHEFDLSSETLVEQPTPLGITIGGSLGISGLRSVSVSSNGILVYRADERNVTQLVWVDRSGRELGLASDSTAAWHYSPRISPDGRLIVVAQYGLRGGLGELWVHDIARKRASRITFGEGDDFGAQWVSPREVLYLSSRPTRPGGLYLLDLDRPQEQKLWLDAAQVHVPVAVTADRRVILQRNEPQGQITLWARDLAGTSEPQRITHGGSSEMAASVSPDGRWLAYGSTASGLPQIYIRSLGTPGAGIPVSANGGQQPRWRADGRELYFVDGTRRLVAVPVTWSPAGEPVLGEQVPLFAAPIEEDNDSQYDVSRDGQRFLLNRAPSFDRLPVSVVLDWRSLVKGQ